MTGKDLNLDGTRQDFDTTTGEPIVLMDFTDKGAETFERIIVMRAGRVILDGTPAEAFAADAWEALRSTYLEPPLAARLGAERGLGSTPTDAALIAALAGTSAEG